MGNYILNYTRTSLTTGYVLVVLKIVFIFTPSVVFFFYVFIFKSPIHRRKEMILGYFQLLFLIPMLKRWILIIFVALYKKRGLQFVLKLCTTVSNMWDELLVFCPNYKHPGKKNSLQLDLRSGIQCADSSQDALGAQHPCLWHQRDRTIAVNT